MDFYESVIEKQIRIAREQGAFDNLAGSGKPLPDMDQQLEPGWWAARLARRERSHIKAQDAREMIADRLQQLWPLADETAVRDGVATLNKEVVAINANLEPTDVLKLVDEHETVTKWQHLTARRNRRLLDR
jgi:hypothetical protein